MKIFIGLFLLILILTGCNDSGDYNNIPIEDYLIGTWVKEEDKSQLQENELPLIRLTEYVESHKGNHLTYSFRNNKIYESPFENSYELNDSTIKYLDEGHNYGEENWNKYKIERLSNERFQLIANFPINKYYTFPEQDSILTYNRVHNHYEYLDSLVQNGNKKLLSCELDDMNLIYGYWKKDSTENISYIRESKYDYLYIDSTGFIAAFWLGRKPSVKTIESSTENNALIVDGYPLNVRCATNSNLILDWNTELPFYEVEYYSRIKHDIIPDSLKRNNKERKHVTTKNKRH